MVLICDSELVLIVVRYSGVDAVHCAQSSTNQYDIGFADMRQVNLNKD